MSECVYVCVCWSEGVDEREREGERERVGGWVGGCGDTIAACVL